MKRSKALNTNIAANLPAETAGRPAFPQALLDHVMAHYKQPSDLIGENGMPKQLTKAVFEAALNAEMNPHLGRTRHGSIGNETGNVRNGHWWQHLVLCHSAKTISGDFGEVEITIPRDRDASFTPQLLPKHQRRVPGFDERILSLYARGMSAREMAAHLPEMPGWRSRPHSSRPSPTLWLMKYALGSHVRWIASTRSSTWIVQWSRPAKRAAPPIGPSTWPLG